VIITTNKLIKSVKARGFVPSSQVALTDEDFIRFANEELQLRVCPFVARYGGAGDEYNIVEEGYTISGDNTITVPARAYSGKIRDIYYVQGGRVFQIPKIAREDKFNFQQVTQYPLGYYMQGNKIVFLPTALNYAGEIRIAYMMRPSDLVMESNARTVTAIDTTAKQLTLNSPNGVWKVGTKLDVTSGENDCTLKTWNIVITGITGSTYTFANDDLVGISTGDILTLGGTTSVPQIPSELHPLLVARTLLAVQSAVKDNGANATLQTINEMEERLKDVLTDRTIGQGDKLVNRNSMLRTNRSKWSRWTSSVL